MRFDVFFVAHAAVTVLTGVAFLFAPNIVLLLFTEQDSAQLAVVTKLLGAAFLGIGGVAFAASQVNHLAAKRGIASALTIASGAGLVVTVQSILAGSSTAVAWGAVAIYLTLTLGYGTFSVWALQR